MTDIMIYQNTGGDISWDLPRNVNYDEFRPIPRMTIRGGEYLRDDDPRYQSVKNHPTIQLVDKMPSGRDIEELQAFIDRGHYKPEWIAGWMDRLQARAAGVESERKAADELADRKAMREALERIADQKSELDEESEGGPPRNSPDNRIEMLLDSKGLEILEIVKSDDSAEERMRLICEKDGRFQGYSSPQWADLFKVDPAAIRKTDFWKELRELKKTPEYREQKERGDNRQKPD